jgi:hypothetical protein
MGQSRFYEGIFCNKGDGIGPFNLAVYWKRKYRQKGPKEPWYILTNLPTLKQALAVYRCRWGIEMCQPQYPHSHLQADAEVVESKVCALPWVFSSQEFEFIRVKPSSQEDKQCWAFHLSSVA